MAPITDEEWADLVAHELPKTSDPVIRTYLESRRALIAQGQKHRSGITHLIFVSPYFLHPYADVITAPKRTMLRMITMRGDDDDDITNPHSQIFPSARLSPPSKRGRVISSPKSAMKNEPRQWRLRPVPIPSRLGRSSSACPKAHSSAHTATP